MIKIRAAGRYENPGVLAWYSCVGNNLIEIGLSDLPKSGVPLNATPNCYRSEDSSTNSLDCQKCHIGLHLLVFKARLLVLPLEPNNQLQAEPNVKLEGTYFKYLKQYPTNLLVVECL